MGAGKKETVKIVKTNLFWLAECEEPLYHEVFDATYTWRWMHASEEFYQGRMNLHALITVLYKSVTEFPPMLSELILPATMMKIAGTEQSLKNMEMPQNFWPCFHAHGMAFL